MLVSALLAILALQDTTPGLSPRARAILDEFRVPTGGDVTIETRFSTRSVFIGEQVELVTAAWIPRDLRERLRRSPTLRAPALSGLWSAPTQTTPLQADTRRVGDRVYDLYVSHQTLFPLGAGPIVSPPAVLSYAVPTSISFFAPEERKSLSSESVSLVVRPIPAGLSAELGNGPTARDLQVRWRLPVGGVIAGEPAVVELVISGTGNVTLWPTPELAWPAGVRIYPEPVEERIVRPGGVVQGEKRFRFTVVADSGGVITLPRIRYPHFDPVTVAVHVASAPALGLAVRPRGAGSVRALLPVSHDVSTPWASRIVRDYTWALALIIVLPGLRMILRRRRRVVPVDVRRPSRETELRQLLAVGAEAAPTELATALRRRGVTRDDAEAVRHWLDQLDRARYGHGGPEPSAPPVLERVVARLKPTARVASAVAWLMVGATLLGAQSPDAVSRYRGGDAAGAARLFAATVHQQPYAPAAWGNLAAARWVAGDEVGAAAAWIRGLELAPRDARLRAAWHDATTVPADVRALIPLLPVSRDELVLAALAIGLAALAVHRLRRRQFAVGLAAVTLACAVVAVSRTLRESDLRALVRSTTPIRISPLGTAPELATVSAWSLAHLDRRLGDWWLVTIPGGARGWLQSAAIAPLSPLD